MSEHQHIESKPLSEEDQQKLAEQAQPIIQVLVEHITLDGAKLSQALLKHLKLPEEDEGEQ